MGVNVYKVGEKTFFMNTQETLEDLKEHIFYEFIQKQRKLYEEEISKVFRWFKAKFPKRHLRYVDGMGTCFWMVDREIFDVSDVWQYNGSGYTVKPLDEWPLKHKILKPLVDFKLSIDDTTNTMPYGIEIGDRDSDDLKED